MSIKLSPSKLDKWALCPRYDSDEFEPSEAAERGMKLHEAVAKEDKSEVDDPDDELQVDTCIEIKKTLLTWAKANAIEQRQVDVIELVEAKFEMFGGANGIVDYAVLGADEGYVVDWKFGQELPPVAKENLQLLDYAYTLLSNHKNLASVKVGLVAPALEHQSWHSYKRIDLDDMELRLTSIRAAVENPESQPRPSAEACRYCANKATCSALQEVAVRVADLPVPTELNSEKLLAPGDMTKAMVLAGVLEDWASRTKRHCLKLALEDGIEVPGFTMQSRAGRRTIVEPAKVAELLKDDKVAEIDVLNASSVSLTKLVDVVSAKGGLTKKAARALVEQKLDSIMVEADRIMWLQKEKGKTYEEIIRDVS